MDKKYTSAITNRTPRPRSQRLREQGIGSTSSTVVLNSTTATGGGTVGDGHTHANKSDLDKISTDSDGYGYLTRYAETESGLEQVTEKVKAGYADVAGNLDTASSDWTTIDDKDAATLKAAEDALAKALEGLSALYLSRAHADTAQGLITFLKGILLGGDGSYGISEAGAATLLSLLVGGKYGISKDGLGTLAGIIADYLKSRDFREGYFDGHGFGLYKDGAGNGVMQVDKLYVTMKAVFAELEIRKLSYVGGDQVHSMAGSTLAMVRPLDKDGNEIADGDTATAVDSYKCYYLDDDGTTRTENWWKTGDMAYCQTFNIEEGVYKDVSNRAYRRLVLRTGTEEAVTGTEDVTTTDSEGNAATTKRNITKRMGYVVLSNRPHGEPFELTTDGLYPVTDSDGNVTNGTVMTYGDSPITFTGMADTGTQDAPAAGDKIVQIGSQCDPGRGYAYIIYVTEQRRVDYAGINDWDLASHAVAQYSPKGSYAYSSSFELRQGSAGGTWHPATDYRGAWQEDVEYPYYNTVTHDGLLWMQNKKDHTSKGDEPGIFSEVWTLVSGGGDLEIEFLASTDVINARGGDVTLEARLMMAGRDMTRSTLLGNSLNTLTWTRDSGIESEDKAWTPTTGGTANILLISQHTPAGAGQREDCGSQWARTRSCTFIFTAILRSKDGSEAQTLSKSISIS